MVFSTPSRSKLLDSEIHGRFSNAELLIVEGDSAARSVNAVADRRFQAVLPMQGKPLNASKSTLKAISNNELYQELMAAIGLEQVFAFVHNSPGIFEEEPLLDALRYSKIIMLFDPDADGIHCGALMLLFFHRLLRPLLKHEILYLVRAPIECLEIKGCSPGQSTRRTTSKRLFAYSDEQVHKMIRELSAENFSFTRHRYRGLGSMERTTLFEACVSPESRNIFPLGLRDAAAAESIFGV